MSMHLAPQVLNSKGQPITLNHREQLHVKYIARQLMDKFPEGCSNHFENALGYEVPITTLSSIMKKITEQKFFQVAPADYLPLRVGEGAWSSNLVTYRSFDAAAAFEEGIVNTGGQSSRLAVADAAVDSVSVQVFNWAKTVEWTIMDIEQAAKAGNWDIVTSKEKARKRNWDLGIQRVAFLGADGLNGATGTCKGLLNQAGATVNTTVITKAISSMTPAELKAFVAVVIDAYRENNNRTAWPDRFVVPESDYIGMASQASAEFPVLTVKELLENAFKLITGKSSFKILPLAYADAQYHAGIASIAGKQVYSLYNSEEESIRMDVPVDYTNTLANSLNNFSLQNVGYGQFTGVQLYRPLELMYFMYTA